MNYASICSLCNRKIADDADACREHPYAGAYLVQSDAPLAAQTAPSLDNKSELPAVRAPEEVYVVLSRDSESIGVFLDERDADKCSDMPGLYVVPYSRRRPFGPSDVTVIASSSPHPCDFSGLPPDKCSHCTGQAHDPIHEEESSQIRADNERLRSTIRSSIVLCGEDCPPCRMLRAALEGKATT